MKEREELLTLCGHDGQKMGFTAVYVPAASTPEDYLEQAEALERRAQRLDAGAKALRGLANHFRRLAEKCGGAGG